MKRINLIGNRYGRLTVINYSHSSSQGCTYWVCKCDCGDEKVICGIGLRGGLTQSCGCLRKEITAVNSFRHGHSRDRLYKTWTGMKQRCYTETSQDYPDYGGRGVTVCETWKNEFMAFREWAIRSGYTDDLTIERLDTSGNYEPGNCTWIPHRNQAINRRSTRFIDFRDLRMTLTEFSSAFDLTPLMVREGYYKGWDADKIIVDCDTRRSRFYSR